MDPFVNMFFAIDKDQTEYITVRELKDYCRDNRLDESMVARWQNLFDPNNTGKISFNTFCDVLGIKREQTRALRAESLRSAPTGLDPDVKVIFESMPLSNQIQIVKEYKRLKSPPNKYDQNEVTVLLKKWLDTNFGRAWQVVIVHGSFWITFSYADHCSFQFQNKDESVLVWRVSSEQ